MGEPKISGFLIGLIIVSLSAVVFSFFLIDITGNYGTTYDNDTLAAYNQLNNLTSLTNQVKNSSEISIKSSPLDVLGEYFSAGYQSLKLTGDSVNIFFAMFNGAMDQVNLGALGASFRVAIISIILVIVIIGIFISIIVKDRI